MRKISFAATLGFLAGVLSAQPQPPGQALFQGKCASCHSAEGGAPALPALNAMPTESIFDALMKGKMKDQTASMTSRRPAPDPE